MVAFAVAAASLSGCSLEQLQIGQWYTINTPVQGACQPLQWRFVVMPPRSFIGSLTRNGQQIAGLTGVLNADDSFQITAMNITSHQVASVSGRFTSQVSTISIRGDAAGIGCDGQTFRLRLGGYFSFQGGGGGGGGSSG